MLMDDAFEDLELINIDKMSKHSGNLQKASQQ